MNRSSSPVAFGALVRTIIDTESDDKEDCSQTDFVTQQCHTAANVCCFFFFSKKKKDTAAYVLLYDCITIQFCMTCCAKIVLLCKEGHDIYIIIAAIFD